MSVVFGPADAIVVARVADEIALLRPDSGETLMLNRSATHIWLACDGFTSTSGVIAGLRRQFPDVDDLAAQVDVVIADLVRRGFLVRREAPLDSRDTSPDGHS